MRTAVPFAFALSLLGACGSDSTPVIDAPVAIDADSDAPVAIDAMAVDAMAVDAVPSSVVEVACPANPASTVTAPGFSFTITQATITVGDIVQFTMPGTHSVVSGSPAGTNDGRFSVGFNTTKCFRFTEAGTFEFWCNPHQFTGTLTVNPGV